MSSPETYVFKCYRATIVVKANNNEEALTKFYLSLSGQIKDLGLGFSLKKCFGTTLYERSERFMVLEGESNLDESQRLNIIGSPDFLSRERLEILLSKGIIKMTILSNEQCFSSLEPEFTSGSSDEKYTSY